MSNFPFYSRDARYIRQTVKGAKQVNSHLKLHFENCNPLESQSHLDQLNRRKLAVDQFSEVHQKTKQNKTFI